MKLQHLAVIFILIIMPISMVISTYVNNLIDVSNKEAQYDTVLMNSTYDAVRAYQINTLHNNFSSVNSSKVRDIETSINSFFNSMASGLSTKGYSKNDLEHYVPSILVTLYDGFYTYGPFENYTDVQDGKAIYNQKRTNVKSTEYGLKPYKFYTCEYKGTSNIKSDEEKYKDYKNKEYHLFINYTLDNYINVYGKFGDKYITKSGYYINTDKIKEIDENSKRVTFYDGIILEPEELGEYIFAYNSVQIDNKTRNLEGERRYYRYINYKEEKYYYDDTLDDDMNEGIVDVSLSKLRNINGYDTDTIIPIFYLDNNLKIYISDNMLRQLAVYLGFDQNADDFQENLKHLCESGQGFKDVNNYYYYKNAYKFSNEMYPILSGIDLNYDEKEPGKNVIKSDTYNNTGEYKVDTEASDGTETHTYHMKYKYNENNGNIFDYKNVDNNDPETEASYFNEHRMDVIISNVESQLASEIANFNNYQYNSSYDFRMPTVSENDWYKIANSVNFMAFMQGFAVGNYKFYNNYALVSDTKNREFISKENFFIQKNIVKNKVIDSPYDKSKQDTLDELYKNNNNDEYYHDPRCAEFHNSIKDDEEVIAYRSIDYEIDSFIHDYYILGDKKTSDKSLNVNYYMQPGTGGYECTVSVNGPMFSYDDLIKGTSYGNAIDPEERAKGVRIEGIDKPISVHFKARTAFLSALAREKGAAFKNMQLLNFDTKNINDPEQTISKD